MAGNKIGYGDKEGQILPEDFERFKAMDTYDSGCEDIAVDGTHDGILDAEQGEFDLASVGLILEILYGKTFPGKIVDINGGRFEMGSIYGSYDEKTSDGQTVTVTMSDYRLAAEKITLGDYKAYLIATEDSRGSEFLDYRQKGLLYPVVGLSWIEMQTYCNYYGGSLPTAAQYEYAAKCTIEIDTDGVPITNTAEICKVNKEHANTQNVFDLLSGILEATADLYEADFYDRMSTQDPSNPYTYSTEIYYVLPGGYEMRGADLNFGLGSALSPTTRYRFMYVEPFNYVGFRCAFPASNTQNP